MYDEDNHLQLNNYLQTQLQSFHLFTISVRRAPDKPAGNKNSLQFHEYQPLGMHHHLIAACAVVHSPRIFYSSKHNYTNSSPSYSYSSISMEAQKATGFLKNAYYQGHGRYVSQLVRLTIKFCKTSGASREVRRFIETKLVDVARENPGCAFYVKPRLYKTPVIKAEYLNGVDHHSSLYHMSSAQIEAWMRWFLSRSGYELYRLKRPITTYKPSIQGIWTPFYWREPSTNIEKFPNQEAGKCISDFPSATEVLGSTKTFVNN